MSGSEFGQEIPVHRVISGDKEIVLVGTAHVSVESVNLVETVIKEERPDCVCVELCRQRFESIRQKERWQNMDILKVIREKKAFLLLANLLLSAMQKKIGEKIGVRPGEEMIKAMDTAEALGAEIWLADRDIQVTMSRAWRGTGVWNRLKLIFQLIFSLGGADDIDEQDIEEMKKEDMLQSILSELGKSQPAIRKILIDERDQYLAAKIKEAPGKKIVAVVGAGHVPGIRKYINENIDIASLETLPPKGRFAGIWKWAIPAAIIALVMAGFVRGGLSAGSAMVTWWVVANAFFAGIGALAALGHPLTIFSAVLAAPLTSLNPMIAAGWVSGLVEAFVRKPKVKDLESLSEDIMSVRGFWRNKVTRILLVVVFSNLGSAVGTFAALPLMMRVMG